MKADAEGMELWVVPWRGILRTWSVWICRGESKREVLGSWVSDWGC